MNYIKLKARAKINITLDVLRKRPDGYHDLKMIMQTIGLYDGVYVEKIQKPIIKIKTNLKWLPTDERNIVYKASAAMIEKYGIKDGIFIELDKRIPVCAGLAGGSSDCAAVLFGINRIFKLGLSISELIEIGASIGSDVPFCILRGTALAEGRGEIIKKLPPCPQCYVVLAKPPLSVSTAAVFKSLNMDNITEHPNTDATIDAIKNNDIYGVANNLCNVLETATIPMYPIISKIKSSLLNSGAMGAVMSGSGPTVYGLFSNKLKAYEAACEIKSKFKIKEVFVTPLHSTITKR